MKIEIKNLENVDSNKLVGFIITDSRGAIFVIDKQVPLVDGKTKEQYVTEALALAQPEIDEWQDSMALVGAEWDVATGTFK